jgi:hypothetical protein
MRLFEVAGNKFQDDLANALKVLQGRADTQKTQSVVPWLAVNNMLSNLGYGSIDDKLLAKVKDKIDPKGELIQDVTPAGIVLKTKLETPGSETPIGGDSSPKSVNQMAHNAVSKDL